MLIGLTGKAGSGKDTACEYMLQWAVAHNRRARRDAFADRLKLSAARIFTPDATLEEALEWAEWLKNDAVITVFQAGQRNAHEISGRRFLQTYGTEAHREVFGMEFWVDQVTENIDPDEITIITDVRFDNEAKAIREAGGEVWAIQRPRNVSIDDQHVSEQPISADLIDLLIINDCPRDQFGERCLMHLEHLVSTEIWEITG